MPTRLELQLATPSHRSVARRRDEGVPMRILLCGDFSGRAGRGVQDPAGLATRPTLRVDIDNLDRVVSSLAPAVEVSVDGGAVPIAFGSLDDFHPDRLFERCDLFARWRGLRERLSDPAGVEQVRAELLGEGAESQDATLSRLLGREPPPAAPAPAPATAVSAVDSLVRGILGSDIAPDVGPERDQIARVIDLEIAERMRALLHDPGFQAPEAAWRTVQFLVNRLDLDQDLELRLLDVARAELSAAAAEPDLKHSALWKAVVEGAQDRDDEAGWSMVVSLEAFDASGEDIALLASLAATAAAAGAPLVATASPLLFGCRTPGLTADPDGWQPLDPDSQARWQALRSSPLAPWIGLVAPRVLLRLPYGKDTDPVEGFGLDEMAGADPARALLWGHPGAACALLAGLAFRDSGWGMDLDGYLEIEDLPAWVYSDGDERRLYPCAETWLGERGGQAVLARGPMALVSRRDRPAARLMRWQSIAEPATALAGPWSG